MVTRRFKRRSILSTLALFITIFCLQAQSNKFEGYILNEFSQPYSGANIRLSPTDTYTYSDSTGYFAFKNVESNSYTLTITAVGYRKIQLEVNPTKTATPLQIQLISFSQQLEEVAVETNQTQEKKKHESLSIHLIEEEFLKEAKAGSLMQTLKKIPGVNSMDVGTGISKPMIRGLSYYRVAVAQNGIKMEGQQWSNHHGVAVDQEAVNHVEIVKGPASLQYGSDAIGGVINLLPVHVPLKGGVTGNVSLVGKTNTEWYGASTNFSYRTGDFYLTSTLSHNSYSDFSIPQTDSFLLITPGSTAEASGIDAEKTSHKEPLGDRVFNTAGQDYGVSLTTGIIKSWGNSYFDFTYYGSENGFFDWQEQNKTNNGAINFPKQQVDNYTINYFTNRYYGDDKLEIALGYQQNKSQEFDYLNDIHGSRKDDLEKYTNKGNLDLWLRLQTFTGNLFYTLNQIKKHTLKIGFNSQYQRHDIDGFNHILPEYSRFTAGLFITDKLQISEKWLINSGLRFAYYNFEMEQSLNPDPEGSIQKLNTYLNKDYYGTAFALGCTYLPDNNTIFKINIGKSYRVPSAYELGAYGLHRHEGRFEKGSIANTPEEAYQLDLGFDIQWNKLQVSVSPFVNYFTNYLYLNPTARLTVLGQIYQYQQAKALTSGGEFSALYPLNKKLELKLGAEYVYAVNLDKNSALPSTPPFNAQTELAYQLKDHKKLYKNKLSIEWVTTASQNYTVINELSTSGYNRINFTASSTLMFGKQALSCMLKINNLLNTKYYNHISYYRRLRIPEPRRDIQLFINIPINN